MLTNCIAPMNEAVEYEELDFYNPFAHDTIYRGPPTHELEEAWSKLWFCKHTSNITEVAKLTNASRRSSLSRRQAAPHQQNC